MILNLYQKIYFFCLTSSLFALIGYDIYEHKKLISKVKDYTEPSLYKIIQDIIHNRAGDTDLQDFTRFKAISSIEYSMVSLIASLILAFLTLLLSVYVFLRGLNLYVICLLSLFMLCIFIFTFSSIQLILDYDSATTTAREYKRLDIFNITLFCIILSLIYISSGVSFFLKTKFKL